MTQEDLTSPTGHVISPMINGCDQLDKSSIQEKQLKLFIHLVMDTFYI